MGKSLLLSYPLCWHTCSCLCYQPPHSAGARVIPEFATGNVLRHYIQRMTYASNEMNYIRIYLFITGR